MKTVYIDVYFFINFTVDLLSLHFASRFVKIPVSNPRLIISSIIGGLYPIALIFLPESPLIFVFLTAPILFIICFIASGKIGGLRKVKFLIAFLIFEILFGGAVYFGFLALGDVFSSGEGVPVANRGLLLLACLILLSIGVIKLIFSLFGGSCSERCARVRVEYGGEAIEFDALIDSGNLVIDPIDSAPVLFLKEKASERLFGDGVPYFSDGIIPEKYKSIVRIIPIKCRESTRLLYGLRLNRVFIKKDNGKLEPIFVTVVIDNERGTFGGYEALIPTSALDNL